MLLNRLLEVIPDRLNRFGRVLGRWPPAQPLPAPGRGEKDGLNRVRPGLPGRSGRDLRPSDQTLLSRTTLAPGRLRVKLIRL